MKKCNKSATITEQRVETPFFIKIEYPDKIIRMKALFESIIL